MGLLAPLYALAALAIAAPIVFHLIRRQPRGQSEFSSLMFLQPSPPRLTRRSRLDNLFLLLLRAVALILIAVAFARPFLRSVELADAQLATREILLLIDTSGSMQRPDVWKRAMAIAEKYVAGLGETDQLGLATFDSKLQLRLPLPKADESSTAPKAQHSAVLGELAKLQPSFQSTRLADSLMAAVEILQERSTSTAQDDHKREIVLISDLHENCGIEALQGFAWPEGVRLDVRNVTPEKLGNARATLMQSLSSDATSTNTTGTPSENQNAIRIRIENNKNSEQVDMQLEWEGVAGSPPVRVQVPPGQARVVPVSIPAGSANRLLLRGDPANFDNVLDIPRTAPRQERIGFIGATRDKPEEDLFFFLSQVPFSTPVRNVTIERITADQLASSIADESLSGLAMDAPITKEQAETIEKYVSTGRPVVIVLSRALGDQTAGTAEALEQLLGLKQTPTINEADENKFALWTEIDFRHPLFLPLADAKFNDFGKIRFWSHRLLELPDAQSAEASDKLGQAYRVLARFDDRSPAVIHRKLGSGDLWVLAAGWQATSSQLALSTKFVPLMYGMFDLQGRSLVLDAVYEVGETIPASGNDLSVTDLVGQAVIAGDANKLVIDTPGLYWLTEDGKRRQISVVLPISESQLDPIDIERFAQYGVVTGKSDSAEELKASARLSQVHELEGRQKLWRWVLVAAIAILIVETFIAWRTSVIG